VASSVHSRSNSKLELAEDCLDLKTSSKQSPAVFSHPPITPLEAHSGASVTPSLSKTLEPVVAYSATPNPSSNSKSPVVSSETAALEEACSAVVRAPLVRVAHCSAVVRVNNSRLVASAAVSLEIRNLDSSLNPLLEASRHRFSMETPTEVSQFSPVFLHQMDRLLVPLPPRCLPV
jgi:hypothetical protein